DVMKQIEYSCAFLFAYSPRKGTPAMRWNDDIPEEVKQDRLQRLMEVHDEISSKQREALLGQDLEVLVECKNSKDSNFLNGRTRTWRKVIFPGSDELIGTLQKVRVHSFSHETMIGELVNNLSPLSVVA